MLKIKLWDIVNHQQFKWENKHTEVRSNICDIIENVTGVQPEDSWTSKIYHSSWLLAKKIKATRKGSKYLCSFRQEQRKWLEGHVITFEAKQVASQSYNVLTQT
jgi:hypothetical protein